MTETDDDHARLAHLARVVTRQARYLAQTDARLFNPALSAADILDLPRKPDLAERVDAFVARLGRLQDTLAGVLLPRLLALNQEQLGTVLDNLNRAERLEWIRSAADWVELRRLRNRMAHEYVEDAQQLADVLNAAHVAMADLVAAAAKMEGLVMQVAHGLRVRSRSCRKPGFGGGTGAQHARPALGLLSGHAPLSSGGTWCRAWTHRDHTGRPRSLSHRR